MNVCARRTFIDERHSFGIVTVIAVRRTLKERIDIFSVQIVTFKERTYNHRRSMPPDREADEDMVISGNIYRILDFGTRFSAFSFAATSVVGVYSVG